jgi:hypothetical protein
MKTIIKKGWTLFLLIALIFTSCKENIIGDFDTIIFTDPDVTTPETISKKGVAFTNNKRAWSHKTSALTPHWMYSWGSNLREEIPENVEFVPMFWGRGSVTDANIDRIKQLIDEGKVKYVLGFNEPDGATQANMTVQEALDLWPRLEELGVPLGSPATVSPNNQWMVDFMARAKDLNLRIDFVTVHSYGGANAANFISKLRQAHDDYELPIWVTEFAVADWTATSPQDNRYTEAQVIDFMRDALSALEEIDWVHRYAWFDGQNAPLYTSALFDDDDNLTALGQVYAQIAGNSIIGPGVDIDFVVPPDPDNLIVNGSFETGMKAPWGGFKSGAVGVSMTEPNTGNFSGRIENGDGSLVHIVTVEPGSSYTFKYFTKWRDDVTNTISPKIRNNAGNALLFSAPDLVMTTTWTEASYQFVVPAGVTELKIVFFKGQGFPPLFLDDVSLKKD